MKRKIEKLDYVLPLCAFAAGCVDIIGFSRLGGVFASAMTGNLALLALYSAAGSIYSAIGSLLALIGFITGAASGTLLAIERSGHKAILLLLGAETMLLGLACVLWFALSHRNGRLSTDGLILILSIAMGLQSICGKRINLSSIPTVVFTSTLTNIVIAVTESLLRRTALPADTKRQGISLLVYFCGALLAGLFVYFGFGIVIFLPFAAAAVAFSIHLKQNITP